MRNVECRASPPTPNLPTGERANHHPDSNDVHNPEALISDYPNEGLSDDKSDDESNPGMEACNSNASVKFIKDAKPVGQQESTACSENISEEYKNNVNK